MVCSGNSLLSQASRISNSTQKPGQTGKPPLSLV